MENSLKLNTRKTMLIFEREKDSLPQKANIYCEVSTDNTCIKYFTWTIASNIHSHLQDAFYDYALAEKKVAFQEVTIIRKTLGLESSPPLDHYALQMQICVLKMPKEHDQHFISFHLPAAAVALGYIYSHLGGGTLSQSMPLSNRECQSTELKPKRPAPVHRESFRLCLNRIFISLQQKHHLNSLTDLFLLWPCFFFGRNFKTKTLVCYFF